MAKYCEVFSQSSFEDLTAFRNRHVLLLVITSNAPGQWKSQMGTIQILAWSLGYTTSGIAFKLALLALQIRKESLDVMPIRIRQWL